MARLEWQRAVYLASIIGNPTYRNEMLYKVAESEASGSASIANEYVKTAEIDSLADRPAPAERTEPDKPPTVDERASRARQAKNENFKKLADAILVDSFEVAKKIDRLIWKYRAMVRIALLAADSQQYLARCRAVARDREWRVPRRGHAASGRITVPATNQSE